MATPKKGPDRPKTDYVQMVAERVIEQLRTGTAPWLKPWKAGELSLPRNPTTDKPYRGMNSMWLAMQGRSDPRWLTYKQAAAIGAQVRKGEKGTIVQYWMWREERPMVDQHGAPVLDGDGKPRRTTVELERPKVISSVVFNGEQIDGLPALELREPQPEFERHARAEAMLKAAPAPIRHVEGDSAHYNLIRDEIVLPMRDQFGAADGFYATALHEIAHSTGHPSRLNRDLAHPFGSIGYAKEELRAEIASLMLGENLGIGHDPGQHAAYIQSWIRALQEDPREIFRASADAEKILSFMLSLEREQMIQQEVMREDPGLAMDRAAAEIAAPALAIPAELELTGSDLAEAQQIAKQARAADWFSDWSDDVDVRRRADVRQSEVLAKEAEYAGRSHHHAAVMSAVVDAIDGHRRGPWYVGLDDRDVDLKPLATSIVDSIDQAPAAKPFALTRAEQEGGRKVEPQISDTRVRLHVPYAEKDAAKALGARWDKVAKTWYAPPGADLNPLKAWTQEKGPEEVARTAQEQFGEAIRAAGIMLKGDPVMDGEWHRLPVDGDTGKERSGSYRGYLTGKMPGGIIRNYREPKNDVNWKFDAPVPTLSAEARAAIEAEQAERKRAQEAEGREKHEAVARAIGDTLSRLVTAPANHPYLSRKDIPAYGALVMEGPAVMLPPDAELQMAFGQPGDLIIPMQDVNGKVWSAQSISPDGRKSMAKGGLVGGNFHLIGDIEKANAWIVTEGYATGADIHRETGIPVAVAFMANNLSAVAQALAEKYPEHARFVAGDNDHLKEAKGKQNVGKEKALEAAERVEAQPLIPRFEKGAKGSDWNDLRLFHGQDEIAAQLQRELAIARRRELRAEIAAEREYDLQEELEQELEVERELEHDRVLDRERASPGRTIEEQDRTPSLGMAR